MASKDYIPTRHSLINRLKNWEDQQSWQDFFDTYWKLIYGMAIKAGLTDAEAQDVVQETVVNVAKKIKDFQVGREHGSFKAWLLQITRWRITDQFRKRLPAIAHGHPVITDRSTARTSTVERIADPASLNLDEVWELEWEQNLAEAALEKTRQQVNPQTYQMFQLHAIKQLPASKVAKTLGVTRAQVYFAKYKVSRLVQKEVRRLETKLV